MVSADAGQMDASSVRVRNATKVFTAQDGLALAALEGVNLSVSAGELTCLVGPSGCGKSTLLRLIAGLDAPTAGELFIGREPISGPSADRGLVFQDPNLFPWLTVRRNIEAGLVARHVLREKRDEVDEFMRLVGLESFANSYPHQLSGGMAQRVALARALVNHPRVLLLDEPLGALDAFTRMRMQDEVLRLWQARGTTMLLVTHDIDEAIYMSDRIVLMTPRPGRIDRILDVDLPRPRQRNDPRFLDLRAHILELLHFTGQATATRDPIFRSTGTDADSGGAARREPSPHRSTSSATPATQSGAPQALDADVIIIGGGPAGSILGSYLAKAGVDHLILDKAVHPRPHVGESLVCSSTRAFQDIGFLPTIENERFVRKYGSSWSHWSDPSERRIWFREIPHLGIHQSWTYHVDRGRFDSLLLRHAIKQGSRVMEGAHVERVQFTDAGVATGVVIRRVGAERSLRCKIVVDASGRATLLGSQLGLKSNEPQFSQFAVHNWFEGVDRGGDDAADFIKTYILRTPRSWAWQIPISSTVTSIGVVTDKDHFIKSGENVEEYFQRQVEDHPALKRAMAGAKAVHEFTREGNYSYVMERLAGPGWMLVGDAARFIDPIFSSGISIAAESARRAADAIVASLRVGQTDFVHFQEYERAMQQGVDIWREFIQLFYQDPRLLLEMLGRPETRPEVLELLQGEVYDRPDVPILRQMRQELALRAG